jgi:hypothetical protein
MSTDDNSNIGQPPAKIMLLGTFHFQDAGLDRYKPRFDVDILSETRQKEVAEVVELLAVFEPTKIAVERRPERQQEMDQNYHAYLRGEFHLSGNEVHQIGFRLARRLGHERVYCIDAWGRYYEPPIDLEAYAHGLTTKELGTLLERQFDFDPERDLRSYAQQHNQEHLLSQWWPHIQKSLERGDERKTQRTLRQLLLEGASEANIVRGHGDYLVDWFKVGTGNEYPGVDFITAWYNRNLRIFANLQRITEAPGERILLIIGGGHVPILRHCVQASPEYDLVELHGYLADRNEV